MIQLNIDENGNPFLEISYNPNNKDLESKMMGFFCKKSMERGIYIRPDDHLNICFDKFSIRIKED